MRVGVIDYGVGNLGSVVRALEELCSTPVLVSSISDMHTVDSLILPGVGNFADCKRLLDKGGWTQALRDEVLVAGKPLLGICVGMQLLATSSMEGVAENTTKGIAGLDFIPGVVENLNTLGCTLRIPHVGWNEVKSHTQSDGIFDAIPDGTDFYFVHSYAFVPDNSAHIIATTDYDIRVTAAVRCEHIMGVQFHPEKSSHAGFRLLRNFIENPKC